MSQIDHSPAIEDLTSIRDQLLRGVFPTWIWRLVQILVFVGSGPGGDKAASDALYANMSPMTAEDIADLFWWLATLPSHLNINTVELMPVSQSLAGFTVEREG